MKLSLFYFTYFFLFILLSKADQSELNINSCPTSRRLLFLGGFNFPLGEKKSEHISSTSKSKTKSKSTTKPPATKYARTEDAHGLTVYIRPQTSSELGHKVHSYSHLLKTKLFNKAERAKLKKYKEDKKKNKKEQQALKKKNITQHATKTRDLVAVNDQELSRCRALLHVGPENGLVPSKTSKKIKQVKNAISSKVKDLTTKAKKQITPIKEKQKVKKEKPIKEKKKSTSKSSETKPLTPSPAKEVPIKSQTTTLSPPTSPPPTTSHTKTKREKPPPPPPVVVNGPTETLDINESDDIDNEEKNNSVVDRAYHFVKNMFQLSDDILENNQTHEDDSNVLSPNEQQHRSSRKLLSIDHDLYNYDFNLYLNRFNDKHVADLSWSTLSWPKRRLLSVKTNKRSTPSKTIDIKEKKTTIDKNKPKVGWAYRYRISRYLDSQKGKHSTPHNKVIGGGKSKQQQQQVQKKISSSNNAKVPKRKLLEFEFNEEPSLNDEQILKQDLINSVSITQQYVPKRQLLSSSSSKKVEKKQHVEESDEDDDDDESDLEKITERRRMKSYEELTDPLEIVRSYDRGLFKPRVGWQFRYRVSRYIDSLRHNIREDQERLKLGLQAIKRKTPQELSGRRKRVLDKPFASETEETPIIVQENKPNVGWRYRYRISKMLEAKHRGDYIDDEDEKRKARQEQKRKQPGVGKPTTAADDDECVEWEFDLDPELRKISEEGKRVGWAYRYRIRRKLDELKQRQSKTGITFDIETLGGGKREKKKKTTTTTTTTTSETLDTEEKPVELEKKAVGWQYRYRISKMREALKQEAAEGKTKVTSKKHEQVPSHEKLDIVLARLTPEERVVGWQYRYRIRRKLDAMKDTVRVPEGGKRAKKHKHVAEIGVTSSKQKEKEKIIKKIEESVEKILNIDDIDETPFMEYVRRGSVYIFSGLLPAAQKSICLLPLPGTPAFCNEDEEESIQRKPSTTTTTETPKSVATKKLKTKKRKTS